MNIKKSTHQDTESIKGIIDEVDRDQLLLPEFQRDYVWPISKSILLFDSIFRELFIGSLILAKPKFTLACKEIDKRRLNVRGVRTGPLSYPIDKTKSEFELGIQTLLDGQQRVTSLYRAIKGLDPIYLVFKNPAILTSSEFWDKSKGTLKQNTRLYDFIEVLAEKKPDCSKLFYIQLSHLNPVDGEMDEDIADKYIKPILGTLGLSQDDEKIIIRIVCSFVRRFQSEILSDKKIISVQLLDLNIDNFCLFFERSNSLGITLSLSDIVTAKVYTKFRLASEVEAAESKYHKRLEEKKKKSRYPWWTEPLIRYLNFKDKKHAGDFSKSSVLSDLTGDSFVERDNSGNVVEAHWQKSVAALDQVLELLENEKWIVSCNRIPYPTMVIPLVCFIENLSAPLSKAPQKQLDYVKLWFYLSLLTGRYGGGIHGSTNVVLKQDCEELGQIANGKFPNNSFWKKFDKQITQEELLGWTSNSNASFQGLLAFLNHKHNFTNLLNTHSVKPSDDLDIHHIFPKKFIKDNLSEQDIDLTDTILNKMLICKTINRGVICDKDPNDYLNEFLKKNPNLKDSLDSHLIPHDLLTTKGFSYKDFLDKRYKEFEIALKEIEEARKKAIAGNAILW